MLVHLVHLKDALGDPVNGTTLRLARSACGITTAWSDRRSVDPEYVTCRACKRTRLYAQLVEGHQ